MDTHGLDRIQELRKYISKDKLGIEVGPWHYPAAPKREGYNCLVLDVFDTQTLLERAKADPLVRNGIDAIEEVDLLGSASDIDQLVGKLGLAGEVDYIVSSHNFEHLPDPIRFLQACEKVLKPGGVLSMAIPDRRTCFDYFRPHTPLSAWLEAYFEARKSPNLKQIFEHQSLHSLYHIDGQTSVTFTISHDPASVVPAECLQEAFDGWKAHSAVQEPGYIDVHCSIFTPASFELLISDLLFLKLVHLQLIEAPETKSFEFFAHLQRPVTVTAAPERVRFYQERASLLHRLNSEAGVNSIEAFRMRSELERALHKITEQEKQIEVLQKKAQDFQSESRRNLDELKTVVRAMQASKSWRVTAPLRAFAAVLRRGRLSRRDQ
jgi:SAM-dependent methyltransferase